MQAARLTNATLHWRADGDPNGPAVVFANSLGTDLRLWNAVIDRLEENFARATPVASEDPLADLGKFFLNRIKVVTSQPGIQSLVFSDQLSHAGGKAGLMRVTKLRRKGRKYIRSCLLAAAQKQLIRQELDIDDILVIFQIFAVFVNCSIL